MKPTLQRLIIVLCRLRTGRVKPDRSARNHNHWCSLILHGIVWILLRLFSIGFQLIFIHDYLLFTNFYRFSWIQRFWGAGLGWGGVGVENIGNVPWTHRYVMSCFCVFSCFRKEYVRSVSIYVDLCWFYWFMLIYDELCWFMLILCWFMLIYVDFMLIYVDLCWFILMCIFMFS